MSDNEIYLLIK